MYIHPTLEQNLLHAGLQVILYTSTSGNKTVTWEKRRCQHFPKYFTTSLPIFFFVIRRMKSANSGKYENVRIRRVDNRGYQHLYAAHHVVPALNPFPKKPLFLRVCSTNPLKTLWENENFLVTSSFSFSHCVFNPFEKMFCHSEQN